MDSADTKIFSRLLSVALLGAVLVGCIAIMAQGNGLAFADLAQ
jgi:hypothetical protein